MGRGDHRPSAAKSRWWEGRGFCVASAFPLHHPLFGGWSPSPASGKGKVSRPMPVIDLTDLPPSGALLGLDLGEKTIGVAVSDATRAIASPIELIRKTRFTAEA